MDSIQLYHAHLYYSQESLREAEAIGSRCKAEFGVEVGTYHKKPVGPHPEWSCQLSVRSELFGKVVPWLALNRGAVDVFIHPVTGNDLDDHTKFVMWLGKAYDLKTDMFLSQSK